MPKFTTREGCVPPTPAVVTAKNGMVATSQPLAVEAGLNVLRHGGTAADAAIAADAMLGLTEPMSCRHRRRSVRDVLGGQDFETVRPQC